MRFPKATLLRLLLLSTLATSLTLPAYAQVVKGSISGSVIDPSGAAVPEADVTATGSDTGAVYKTRSDAAGLFHIALMSIGTYQVSVERQGFRAVSLPNVQVSSAQDTSVGSLKLEIGQTTTTVEVSGAAPLVEATQAQVSSTFSSQLIQALPGVQENQGLDLLALQVPGVVQSRDSNFSNTNGMGFSVNGLRGRSNDQQIDGQNNNDNSVTGPAIFIGDDNFVQEYQITTNNFGSEYGRNSGSVVNILTKQGTNNWHGDVYGTEGNSALDSLSNTQKAFEGLTKVPHYNEEFAGATIGGPLVKDKAFVFGGFSQQLDTGVTGVLSTGSLTPDPTGLGQLAACFPGSTSVAALQKYGPFGVSGGDPQIEGAPQTAVVSTPGGGTCDVEVSGVQRTVNQGSHQYNAVLRFDVQGQKDHVYGRWVYQKLNFFDIDEGTGAAGYPENVPSLGTDWGLDWTHNLGATVVDEARFSYGRSTAEFGGNLLGNTVPPDTAVTSALASVSPGRVPLASGGTAGGIAFGPGTSFPQGRIVNTYQTQDNLNYIHGVHQFKMGVNWTYQRSPNLFLPNGNGAWSYGTLSDFAANVPTSVSITVGSPTLDFREHDLFAYVGDDWKVKPNLTLNLGLTWSYFTQASTLFHNADLKNEQGDNPFFDPALPVSVRVFPTIPAAKNDFGPSAGFAWTPSWGGPLFGNGKTVLRGGYRLTYDPIYYNIYLNIASSAPQVLAQTLTGTDAQPLMASPLGPAVRSQLAPFLTFGVQDPRNFNQTDTTPDFRPDHVQEWTFGVQRELSTSSAFEVRYVGNHGGNLFQSINANPYVADLAADFPNVLPSGITPCPADQAVVPRAAGRVNCDEGVLRRRTNTGVSDYEAVQFEFRATNLARQLSLRTSYTISKTTDNVTDIFGTGVAGNTVAFSQDPLNFISAEHGLSGLDIPQNWTLGLAWQIPAFRDQRGALGHVLGGWSLAGTYFIASGQPYSPVQFFFNEAAGGANYFDTTFDQAFNLGLFETGRPFLASPSAPVTAVGVYAGDACNYAGVGCELTPTALLDFNNVNHTGNEVPVEPSQVRFIMNGPTAQSVHGTPFGTAARNSLRDSMVNTANLSLYKTVNLGERIKVQWHVSMLNAFNHPNFSSVDPILEDLGDNGEGDGFGVPQLQPSSAQGFTGGTRTIRFGVKLLF